MAFLEIGVDCMAIKDFWDQAVTFAAVAGSFASCFAALFSAISANSSRRSLIEARSLRNPILIIEPKFISVLTQIKDNRGIATRPFEPADNSIPECRPMYIVVSNFGSGPAANAIIGWRWLDRDINFLVPDRFLAERVQGHARFGIGVNGISFRIEGEDNLLPIVTTPLAKLGSTNIGSIGSNSSKTARIEAALSYALIPFMLNDAVASEERLRKNLNRDPIEIISEPVAQHVLEICIEFDSITGDHLSQYFHLTFESQYAVDRTHQSRTIEADGSLQARIEGSFRVSLSKMTFPSKRRPPAK